MQEVAAGVLRRCLAALQAFECPSHHRHYYDRTEAALRFLLEPSILPKLVFLYNATFAPICADLVPDSGVSFLRGIGSGPGDIAAEAERSPNPGSTIFTRLWDDALGLEFEAWRPLAEQSPIIFVRLGKSVQRPDGRWAWALLDDIHLVFAFDSPQAAFDHLEAAAREAGDYDRLDQLLHLRYGVIYAGTNGSR